MVWKAFPFLVPVGDREYTLPEGAIRIPLSLLHRRDETALIAPRGSLFRSFAYSSKSIPPALGLAGVMETKPRDGG